MISTTSVGLAPIVPKLLVLYPSANRVCGVGTWLDSLIPGLEVRGWDVAIGLAWGRKFNTPAYVEQTHPAFRTYWMDGRTGTSAGRALAIAKAIRQIQPDIVLVTLLDDIFHALRYIPETSCKARFVVANHGNAPEHLARLIEQITQLDLVATVNRASFELLKARVPATLHGRLAYIPNCVSLPTRPRSQDSSVITIGYVGRLGDDKRFLDVVEFLKYLPVSLRYKLLIAGEGPHEEAARSLEAEGNGRVQYLGFIPKFRLYKEVYPQLDILISFSPSEGWPLGIAEGMACGAIPVVSEYCGIHAERVIQHQQTGLIFPVGRPDLAAHWVSFLARNPEARIAIRTNATSLMLREFTPDKFAARWSDLLTDCLQRPTVIRAPRASLALRLRKRTVEAIRRRIHWYVPHSTARAEWPQFNTADTGLLSAIANQIAEIR